MTTENPENALDPERVRGWFQTYLDDKCVCRYCGFDGRRSPEDWMQLQGDHLIPRRVAQKNAEDSLNRVTACAYCNMVKRNFDPAEGRTSKVASRDHQQALVERACKEIERRKARTWGYAGGPEKSFQLMMQRMKD